MKRIFADAGYWIALVHPRDPLHTKAQEESASVGDAQVVTSQMVLVEVLSAFAGQGAQVRQTAGKLAQELHSSPSVAVVQQSSAQFHQALALYRRRDDKGWSLTDCASFLIMQKQKITDALTEDRHFEQAGFKALLRAR
ncbi:MAG: type II toxin-antitoxin system VapC family toxin [Verrucomicrobia bacterium]|nr:type II toxin-antitoxin system VapC family toxin [Verrucomicrobiota bacterium]